MNCPSEEGCKECLGLGFLGSACRLGLLSLGLKEYFSKRQIFQSPFRTKFHLPRTARRIFNLKPYRSDVQYWEPGRMLLNTCMGGLYPPYRHLGSNLPHAEYSNMTYCLYEVSSKSYPVSKFPVIRIYCWTFLSVALPKNRALRKIKIKVLQLGPQPPISLRFLWIGLKGRILNLCYKEMGSKIQTR